MRIDIWSDIVCPWCAIGKARLEAALARFEHAGGVEVRWRSFELDPGAPAVREGEYAVMLARKYGTSPAGGRAMHDRVTGAAAGAGLEFRLGRARPGNSFDAHRLVRLAADRGVQSRVMERLMRGYLCEGEAIGDRSTLARLAAEAGLDGGEARGMLDSGSYADAVRADEREARRLGVTAVPFFLVGGRLAVPGAQSPEVMLQVLRRAWPGRPETVMAAGNASDGPVCGPGG